MSMPSTNNFTQRLNTAVRQDPKKFGTLAVLSLLLLVMLGRAIFSSSPATVVAATTTPAGTKTGTVTRVDKAGNVVVLPDAPSPEMSEWLRTAIVPLTRNLFAVKLDYYPQDGSKVGQTLRAPEGDGFWDKVAKSMASKADQRKERQILIENLQLQAMQIKLQSTVMGATPRALINGGMVREGDVVASFRVLKIEARRIIVEREGIKLEIPMN